MADAGKVAILPKGLWSAETVYEPLDLVYYENNSYVALKESVGVAPVDSDTWMLSLSGISQETIDSILNGTQQVGDSAKLGGKDASEYFLADGSRKINGNIEVVIDTPNQRMLRIKNSVKDIYLTVNGSGEFALYDNTLRKYVFKSTPEGEITFYGTASGNLPLTGGKLLGKLETTQADGNGYSRLMKNNSATADYGTQLRDFTADGTYVGLALLAKHNRAEFVDNTGKSSEILHTGNKPTGTYTGNGSDTLRTIATGGLATSMRMIYIYCGDYGTNALVTGAGTLCWNASGTEVVNLPMQDAELSASGVLTIKSTSKYLNYSGYLYGWRLL